MIMDPNWMNKLGSAETDAEAEALLLELAKLAQGDDAANADEMLGHGGPETAIAGHTADDKLLMHSIVEFNSALFVGHAPSPNARTTTSNAANDSNNSSSNNESVRLTQRPKKKTVKPINDLRSVQYKSKANPAILNCSTAHFQDMLGRFNMKRHVDNKPSKLVLGTDGRATYAPTRDTPSARDSAVREAADLQAMDKDQLIAMLLSERGITPSGSGSGSGSGRGNASQQKVPVLEPLDLAAARASSAPINSARVSARAASGSGSGRGSALSSVPEAAAADAPAVLASPVVSARVGQSAEMNITANPSRPESSSLQRQLEQEQELANKPQTGNALLAPLKIATSPIKPSSRGGSAGSGTGSSSARTGLLSLSAEATGSDGFVIPTSARDGPLSVGKVAASSKAPTPRTSARGGSKSGTMGKSASMPTFASTAGPASARATTASKPSATMAKLGISGTAGSTVSLSKARLADIRALRDHLLTTAGSFALNVNPDSSPDAQQEVQESIAITRDMVAATMNKNRVDQTWDLITTPGYYEAVGPDEIFKSDIHANFVDGPAFQKAVRTTDRTKGIKRDGIKAWAEDGKKNNIEIFASGGAMRT